MEKYKDKKKISHKFYHLPSIPTSITGDNNGVSMPRTHPMLYLPANIRERNYGDYILACFTFKCSIEDCPSFYVQSGDDWCFSARNPI